MDATSLSHNPRGTTTTVTMVACSASVKSLAGLPLFTELPSAVIPGSPVSMRTGWGCY
jgi:hypothetical protein